MARFQPEESSVTTLFQSDHISDDDHSIAAADSWSVKSDYGSILDDDQHHVDPSDSLPDAAFDYSFAREEPDADSHDSEHLLSCWAAVNPGESTNFREHGHAAEVWFRADIVHVLASWTRSLCVQISRGQFPTSDDFKEEAVENGDKYLCDWNVLDLGTGNGLLLRELAKEGFSELMGIDHSEGAVVLAQSLANRDGFAHIKFLVDDVLESKLDKQFKLVMDNGNLDAVGLHPDSPIKRIMYWDSVSKLVASGGFLVITSSKSTKDELLQEAENYNRRVLGLSSELDADEIEDQDYSRHPPFRYVSDVRSYPTFTYGGISAPSVATVAFLRN